ncbi:hypothetical protein FGB62_281g019 [Gracilaria domingensis]|nr:hypothetical protein FGB62_281g019 [Gracilaria domingensis]
MGVGARGAVELPRGGHARRLAAARGDGAGARRDPADGDPVPQAGGVAREGRRALLPGRGLPEDLPHAGAAGLCAGVVRVGDGARLFGAGRGRAARGGQARRDGVEVPGGAAAAQLGADVLHRAARQLHGAAGRQQGDHAGAGRRRERRHQPRGRGGDLRERAAGPARVQRDVRRVRVHVRAVGHAAARGRELHAGAAAPQHVKRRRALVGEARPRAARGARKGGGGGGVGRRCCVGWQAPAALRDKGGGAVARARPRRRAAPHGRERFPVRRLPRRATAADALGVALSLRCAQLLARAPAARRGHVTPPPDNHRHVRYALASPVRRRVRRRRRRRRRRLSAAAAAAAAVGRRVHVRGGAVVGDGRAHVRVGAAVVGDGAVVGGGGARAAAAVGARRVVGAPRAGRALRRRAVLRAVAAGRAAARAAARAAPCDDARWRGAVRHWQAGGHGLRGGARQGVQRQGARDLRRAEPARAAVQARGQVPVPHAARGGERAQLAQRAAAAAAARRRAARARGVAAVGALGRDAADHVGARAVDVQRAAAAQAVLQARLDARGTLLVSGGAAPLRARQLEADRGDCAHQDAHAGAVARAKVL